MGESSVRDGSGMTDRTDDFKFIAAALPPPARVSPPPPKVRHLHVRVLCLCLCVVSYLDYFPLSRTSLCRTRPAHSFLSGALVFVLTTTVVLSVEVVNLLG